MQSNAVAGPSRAQFQVPHIYGTSQSPHTTSTPDRSPSNNHNVGQEHRGSGSPDVDGEGTTGFPGRRRYTRSTKGCLTCRAQKVKCDEVHPTCNKCESGQRTCEWPSAEKLARPRKRRRKEDVKGESGAGSDDPMTLPKLESMLEHGSHGYDHARNNEQFDLDLIGLGGQADYDEPPDWISRSSYGNPRSTHNTSHGHSQQGPMQPAGHALLDHRFGTHGNVSAERSSPWEEPTPSYNRIPFNLGQQHAPDPVLPPHPAELEPLPPSFDVLPQIQMQQHLQAQSNVPHSLPLNLALLTDFPLPPHLNVPLDDRTGSIPPLSGIHPERQESNGVATQTPTFNHNLNIYTNSPISASFSRADSPKTPSLGGNALEHSLLAHRRRLRSGNGGAGADPGDSGSIRSFEEIKLTHGINIEALANAAENDPYLVEQGPFTHLPVTAPASLAALTSAFPSPFSLQLFHHFFNYTTRILITMGDIGPNPHLTLCTPARLLDTGSAASAALRMSMLSTSTAHLVHAAEGGPLGIEPMRRWSEVKDKLLRLGDRFRRAALQNVVLSDNDEKDQFDTILATCVLLMIRDVISAGSSWRENMEFAIQLVFKRGGAAQLISREPQNFMRRFLIENLLVHNVFSCFVTNKEPALLNKFDPWWFECQEYSKTRWEWESVERTFGISRVMVDIISRVVSLNAQKKRLGIDFHQSHDQGQGRSDNPSQSHSDPSTIIPALSTSSLSPPPLQSHPHARPSSSSSTAAIPFPLPRTSSSSRQIEAHLTAQAESLLNELEVLGNGLGWVPRNHRVSCGDMLYRYMSIVYLLGDILERPSETPQIVQAIDYCLELCSEASAMRMSVMLIWPLLICGTYCSIRVREKVASLFDAFAWDYCDDLKAARVLMDAQWKAMDGPSGRETWAGLMSSLGMSVLVI